MKSCLIVIFLATAACIVSAVSFSEEVYMLLPFLRNIEPIPSCPPNELYKTCARKCSDCVQRGQCMVEICKSGCDCAPRFFRLTPDGPCEPVANCPKPECGENEVFRECGPICERCNTVKCQMISCDHKCYCKEGYLRNEQGMCVPTEECPKRKRCSHNEEWAENGPVEEFCLNGENKTSIGETQSKPQCYCKEGYKRNALGHCVINTLCPLIRCLGVEVYHNCVPKCNTTCRNYGNPNCTEDDNCYPGCFCPPGYVMNDFRSCIFVEDCSLDLDQLKIDDSLDEDEPANNETAVASSSEDVEDVTNTTITSILDENAENCSESVEESPTETIDSSITDDDEKPVKTTANQTVSDTDDGTIPNDESEAESGEETEDEMAKDEDGLNEEQI